jgi:hypothetical protein
MYRYLCSALIATTLLTSCHDEKSSSSSISEQMQTKPKVAIAPVIDSSEEQVSWSLSDELTYSLYYRLEQNPSLNVADPQKIKSIVRKLKSTNDPFRGDLSWVRRSFSQDDFVVFLEVIEHEEAPNLIDSTCKPQECSASLNMTCKVIVVDVREDRPKLILQEIVHDTHFIPKQFNKYNFHQASWGHEEFYLSPVGMAHAQFLKEISSRIEEYILLSQDM